jgi:hypothetical protein
VRASLFGSAARADGGLDSDIDLFLVRRSGVDAEDPVWSRQLADLSSEVMVSTGNTAGIIDFAENDIQQLLADTPPVLWELRRNGIDLAGTPLRELLRSVREPPRAARRFSKARGPDHHEAAVFLRRIVPGGDSCGGFEVR